MPYVIKLDILIPTEEPIRILPQVSFFSSVPTSFSHVADENALVTGAANATAARKVKSTICRNGLLHKRPPCKIFLG